MELTFPGRWGKLAEEDRGAGGAGSALRWFIPQLLWENQPLLMAAGSESFGGAVDLGRGAVTFGYCRR
jgi:hypothetical protein